MMPIPPSCVNPEITAFDVMQTVAQALHRDMRFDAKATTVDTSPDEAFAGRRGVCQDFAHIMIACLRGLGMPAGYVSGFLRTIPPAGKQRLAGADAMHAWVRGWCGSETGWIEFDPTQQPFGSERPRRRRPRPRLFRRRADQRRLAHRRLAIYGISPWM